MSKKILVVVTNVAKYPSLNRATGLWFGEAVHFVDAVQAKGVQVDFVSPDGGYVPIDPKSMCMADQTEWAWYQNKAFMNRLGATFAPGQVKASDYAAIYYTGGHGVIWDFPENTGLQALARDIFERNGIVASVCHGAVGLLNIKLSNNSLLLKDRKVTGFSNIEEQLVELDKVVPYLTENELGARGGVYSKTEDPWESYVVADEQDGRLITGQNPASSRAVAQSVLAKLGIN